MGDIKTADTGYEFASLIVQAVGPVGVALLCVIGFWIYQTNAAKKRAIEQPERRREPGYALGKLLHAKLEQVDTHVKEHTAVSRDTQLALERLAATVVAHSETESDDIRAIRDSQMRVEALIARMTGRMTGRADKENI